MPMDHPSDIDRSLLEEISETVDRFEAAIKAGDNPQIETYLGGWNDPALSALLAELVGVELECRVRRGEKPALLEYQNRFPQQRHVIEEEFPAKLGNYDV